MVFAERGGAEGEVGEELRGKGGRGVSWGGGWLVMGGDGWGGFTVWSC